jgi:hypothetical protein
MKEKMDFSLSLYIFKYGLYRGILIFSINIIYITKFSIYSFYELFCLLGLSFALLIRIIA